MNVRLGVPSRRGAVLALLGVVWIIIGVSVVALPTMTPGVWLFHEHLPLWLRASAWIGTGVIAVAASPFQWPPGKDRFGFNGLIIMPAQRFASYLFAWVVSLFNDSEYAYSRGWLAAAVWGALCGIVLVCASWPNPTRPVPPPPGGG